MTNPALNAEYLAAYAELEALHAADEQVCSRGYNLQPSKGNRTW